MPIVPGASQQVPGLRLLPDWLDATECAALLAAIDGEEWTSPLQRRVQHYGHRYDYGSRRVTAGGGDAAPPIPGWLAPHGVRLVEAGFVEPGGRVVRRRRVSVTFRTVRDAGGGG